MNKMFDLLFPYRNKNIPNLFYIAVLFVFVILNIVQWRFINGQ